jgi:hypothetical protein
MDAMGNYTGGSVDPFAAPDNSTTATTQVAQTAPAPQSTRVNGIPSKYRTGPVSADYNASIAQQESGNNPNIGFHNREKGTAYGTYGLTDAAYQDARRANPNLPVDKTQSTPEQQTAAMNAYTQGNAAQLKKFGIEPTDSNLSAAHLLGATGLKRFNESGYLSPQAIAANGGEENLRKIVNQRLGGQAGPASGAVEPNVPQARPQEGVAVATGQGIQGSQTVMGPTSPEAVEQQAQQFAQELQPYATTATTAITPTAEQGMIGGGLRMDGKTQADLERDRQHNTILNSNSQETLSKLAFDINTPKDVANAALDKLHGTMAVDTGMNKAKKIMADLGANPNPQALNKAMNDKDTGSYFKVLLFQALGWTGKAQQELDKINPKTVYSQTSLDGINYRTKVNPNTNEILGAWDADGVPTDQKTLNKINAEGFNAKAMGNVKELVKVGDKTIGVYQDGSMIDLATKQRYTGSLAGAEKIVGTGIEGGETGLVDPTTNVGGYSRAYENNKLVIRDAAGKIVEDEGIKSRIIKTGVGGETPAQKAMNKRVEAALEQLTKDYKVPTDEQKIKALRDRAVPDAMIEEKLGLTPGSLKAPGKPAGGPVSAGPAPAAPVSPQQAAPAGTSAGVKPVSAGIGPKPQQPEFRPQRPGEDNKSYDAYQKQVKESYDSELDVWKKKQDRVEKRAEELPAKQQAAEESLSIVDRLVKHPGFSDVIGFPNILTGIYSPPTTDARNFKALYKQVQGDQFLAAVRQMRGSGALSEVEGEKATAAISAMQDPYISEAEFKNNAKIYMDVIKRGIDAQRREVGLDPVYPDVKPAGAGSAPAAGGVAPGTRKTIPGRGDFIFDGKGWKPA